MASASLSHPIFNPSIFSPSSPAFSHTRLYKPIEIRKEAIYTPHSAGHVTTIDASWGPMTMIGSYYLVKEAGSSDVYGSTVEAWRETNRLVEGEAEGEGVWVKTGLVRAVQAGEKGETMAETGRGDDVADGEEVVVTGAKSLPSLVPVEGMVVVTYHNGKVETERMLEKGEWVVRQESSNQREVMILSDSNFRRRYKVLAEGDE